MTVLPDSTFGNGQEPSAAKKAPSTAKQRLTARGWSYFLYFQKLIEHLRQDATIIGVHDRRAEIGSPTDGSPEAYPGESIDKLLASLPTGKEPMLNEIIACRKAITKLSPYFQGTLPPHPEPVDEHDPRSDDARRLSALLWLGRLPR